MQKVNRRTMAEARKELESIEQWRRNVARQKQRLIVYRDRCGIAAVSYDRPIVRGGSTINYDDRLVDLAEVSIQADEVIRVCESVEKMVDDKISRIDDHLLAELLITRYLSRLEWDIVADIIGYSVSYSHKLHNKALKAYAEVM